MCDFLQVKNEFEHRCLSDFNLMVYWAHNDDHCARLSSVSASRLNILKCPYFYSFEIPEHRFFIDSTAGLNMMRQLPFVWAFHMVQMDYTGNNINVHLVPKSILLPVIQINIFDHEAAALLKLYGVENFENWIKNYV